MMLALLGILKFLGILILAILGTVLFLLLLVMFVPIRYKVTAHRKIAEDVPVVAEVKITWLLHILNIAFSYPKAAYVRVRLFCFTVFRTGNSPGEKPKSGGESGETEESAKEKKKGKEKAAEGQEDKTEAKEQKADKEKTEKEKIEKEKIEKEKIEKEKAEADNEETEQEPAKSIKSKFVEFFRKLLEVIQNIRYTITGIYDKIKHIVNNIQYYIKIIKSDAFKRAWTVCSGQVLSLLKSIRPRKISGTLLIGTGDPASTGQVMAAYGILYPLIGDHIDITPDFERQIVEGDLLVKGKITVFMALKAAWIMFFNRDLRRLIKLFKREAA